MISNNSITGFKTVEHQTELCIIGGGIAGMFAAISAARRGTRVVLMQDRPVLGGNASSEIRMWIRGAHGENNRETGLLEELALENIYRNPGLNFSLWDGIMYEKVQYQKNITLLLNCSCCDAEILDNKILSITGWQTTTQKWHKVTAKIFADCSGDSVLAPLTGAEYRVGQEGADEFGETIAPKVSNNQTMGLSCLIQARETNNPVKFIPPNWVPKYTEKDFNKRLNSKTRTSWSDDNFWWMELGGVDNSLDDTEEIRERLVKVAYGTWNYIKNSGKYDSENWDIEWIGFLPGKRESRRYVGDFILSEKDVLEGGHFDDIVAYGGWTIDNHNSYGFEAKDDEPTIYTKTPSPFGIPYRSLYSKNIDNLMFAGRNISATHAAMAATRVMGTCGIIGQAVGTAADLAIKNDILPREIYTLSHIKTMQKHLMDDDCYVPFHKREASDLTKRAVLKATSGNTELLIDGVERCINGVDHAWEGNFGDEIVFSFEKPMRLNALRIVLDSDLNRVSHHDYHRELQNFPMRCNIRLADKPLIMPKTLLKSLSVYIDKGDNNWVSICDISDNCSRLLSIPLNVSSSKIKIIPHDTWGSNVARIYSLDII